MWDLRDEYLKHNECYSRCPRCSEKLLLNDIDLGWTNCIGCGLTYGVEEILESDSKGTTIWKQKLAEIWGNKWWKLLSDITKPLNAGSDQNREPASDNSHRMDTTHEPG